jgi:hypothetical protein
LAISKKGFIWGVQLICKKRKVGRLRYLEEGKSFWDHHLFILSFPFMCVVLFLEEFFKVIIKEIKVKGSFVCGGTMLYLEIRNNNLWVLWKSYFLVHSLLICLCFLTYGIVQIGLFVLGNNVT